MGNKVTANPATKIIQVDIAPSGGEISLDIKADLYSDLKEDWRSTPELFKRRFPITVLGGNPTPKGFLGTTYFLDSAWKIRPYEGDHRFIPSGNLFSVDGTSPYTQTVGNFNVIVEAEFSNLVDTVSSGSGLSAQESTWVQNTYNTVQDNLTNLENGWSHKQTMLMLMAQNCHKMEFNKTTGEVKFYDHGGTVVRLQGSITDDETTTTRMITVWNP